MHIAENMSIFVKILSHSTGTWLDVKPDIKLEEVKNSYLWTWG